MTDEHGVATEIELVVQGRHADPHHVLGLHETADGVVVRSYRPEAERVRVLVDGEVRATLARVHDAGVFAGVVAPAGEPPGEYLLEVSYPGGAAFRLQDPYRFLPTLGELDLHLMSEGRHEEVYRRMGARVLAMDGVRGTAFAVWAPNAQSVRVIGEFNGWDGRLHPMRSMGGAGIWELFLPDVGPGNRYKFEILTSQGWVLKKADPYARGAEAPPATAGVIQESAHTWTDGAWMQTRRQRDLLARPMSIYEVHLGSWRRGEGDRVLGYRECADLLAEYCTEMGFTHVEFLPLAEHPYGPSWGYQVSYYYAPTARYGAPDDLRYLVDRLHASGIGVIMDWVPAHFPRDDWALARYDGTALYEHADPRQGEHPDWGTLVFNFGRNEVRNFLIANALYWLDEFHVDGLRVDAVASMLYLDYSRKEGEWVPNRYGGRENIEAIQFLQELNTVVHGKYPGVIMIAEESTAWGGVSRPTWTGGLGFGFKWNMGWMHDTLDYFSKDPIHRRFHHHQLTFALIYAWHENFILPLSHDEVVHGKRSLLDKMPGDFWQRFANLRTLLSFMYGHPGKKLLFMGSEIGQWQEWSESRSLDWHLLQYEPHQKLQAMVRDLNHLYRNEPALYQVDFDPAGFEWIDFQDSDNSIITFMRKTDRPEDTLIFVCNFTPVYREAYRIGVPWHGFYREIFNSDSGDYWGTNKGNYGGIQAEEVPFHGRSFSINLVLPPLATVIFKPGIQ